MATAAASVERLLRLARGDGLRAQLLRSGTGSMVIRIFSLLLTLALSVILARVLGPEGLGTYAYAFALMSLLAIPVQSGMPVLAVREVAGYEITERWGHLRGLLIRLNQAIFLFAMLVALVAGIVAWLFADRFTVTQLATFTWALLLLPLVALGNLRGATLQGLRKVVQGQLPELVLRPVFLLGLILVVLFWAGAETLDPAGAMALHVLAASLAFAVGAVLLWRALPTKVKTVPAEYESSRWLTSVLPLSFIAGMQVITGQTDILMLGIFTTAHDVGLYRVALQGAMLVIFIHAALNLVVAPHIARIHKQGDMPKVQHLVTWSARMVLLGALPVAGVLIFYGEPILRWVFGVEYADAHITLAILCGGKLVIAASGAIDSLLKMTGYERVIAKSIAIAAGANILLNALLIPRFGMEGAAAATVLTMLVWKVYLVLQTYRRLGLISLAFYSKSLRESKLHY